MTRWILGSEILRVEVVVSFFQESTKPSDETKPIMISYSFYTLLPDWRSLDNP